MEDVERGVCVWMGSRVARVVGHVSMAAAVLLLTIAPGVH